MITDAFIYQKATGRIMTPVRLTLTDDETVNLAMIDATMAPWGDDFAFLFGVASASDQYVVSSSVGDRLFDKPAMPVTILNNKTTIVANGVDSATLLGLPNPCEVIQDPGEPEEYTHTVTGGGFVITTDTPGTYRFQVNYFPFAQFNVDITAI